MIQSGAGKKRLFEWRIIVAAIVASLRRAYHRSIPLDLWIWLPALVYYVWLNQFIWLGAQFVDLAGQLRGLMFLGCQGLFTFLLLVTTDGWLAAGRRQSRTVFVVAVHIFLACLYLDCVLYRHMSLHLWSALQILLQDGLAGLTLNWAQTGITRKTLITYCLGSLVTVVTICGYSWGMTTPRASAWRANRLIRMQLGRLALVGGFLLAVCQMLSRSDDHTYQIHFAELRKSLPIHFGFSGIKPGHRLVIQGLRPLRDFQKTTATLEALDIKAGVHPDIFVFVLESTRSDYIDQKITPHLVALRDECLPLSQEGAWAAANASHVSWYALLSANHGLYFGMEKRAASHPGSVPLRLFRRLGYKVNVFCSNTLDYQGVAGMVFGDNLQLCDLMFDAQKLGLGDAPTRDRAINQQLLKSLNEPAGNRLFFIFYDSTHHDYDWPSDDPTPFTPYATSWNYGDFRISPKRLELIKNRYRNALSFVDRLIGEILTCLKEKNAYENSIIAVTSDHGEEFLEHGKLLHASNLFRPQTSVPFFMRIPAPLIPLADETPQLPTATHVDLLPTLLDTLGVTTSNLFDGQSLFRKTADESLTVAENHDSDPVRFCLQSPYYRGFFEFEHERQPTVSQSAIRLQRVTDLNDVPLKLELSNTGVKELLRTNYNATLRLLFSNSNW